MTNIQKREECDKYTEEGDIQKRELKMTNIQKRRGER